MALLALIALTALMIWLAVLIRFRPALNVNWILFAAGLTLVAAVVFGREFYALDLGPVPITIDRALLAIIFSLAIYQHWSAGRWQARWDTMDLAVLIWFACLAANTFLTDWRFHDNLPLSRLLFLNFLPLVMYLVVKHAPGPREQNLRPVAWLMLGLSLYLSVTAIAEWRGWHSLVFPKHIMDPAVDEFLGRGRGPLQNPVINGMLMVVCGAASLVLFRPFSRKSMALIAMAAVPIGFGVYVTLTRSVWLAAAASFIVVAWAYSPWRLRVAGLCLLLAIGPVGWMVSKEVMSRFKRDEHVTVEEMEQSAALRPMFAYVAWKMFQERPLTGFGFGQYQKHKTPFHYDDRFERPLQPALAYFQHNVFLAYLVDLGLMGLVALLAMLAVMAGSSWQLWRRGSVAERNWGLVGWIVLINYTVNGMFHDTSIIPQANMVLLFVAGIVGRLAQASAISATPVNAVGPLSIANPSTPHLSQIR
ncbi:MAG TPA: O-antigen ligase family protein [Pirellulaceae bacterium]|nr:O-antigen ligase family protein [Pirellulaceae bacterium]